MWRMVDDDKLDRKSTVGLFFFSVAGILGRAVGREGQSTNFPARRSWVLPVSLVRRPSRGLETFDF